MLRCLRIRNLAIIESLEVELGPGLNVMTGETGAGKSILVSALQLVLGARGRAELVRTGSKQAEVEALFELEGDSSVAPRLAEMGIELEGDELLIRRVVLPTGRTRAYINGTMTTAAQLGKLAAGLADICSQHEHHTLVDPGAHLALLDAYARSEGRLTAVREAHEHLRAASAELEEFAGRLAERSQREDLLRFHLQEIDELGPEPDGDAQLAEVRERLRHTDQLEQLAGGAERELYAQDGSLCESLARIADRLFEAATLDPSLNDVAAQLDSARTQLEESARELGQYNRALQSDPGELARIEERLHALSRLERKYGGSLEAVLAYRTEAERELRELDGHEQHDAELHTRREQALDKATRCARELSRHRRSAAGKLGAAMAGELASLGMGGARIVVDVAPLEGDRAELQVDGARLSSSGIDRVEFLIAPNRGEDARPLRRVASGGELSRALLAIKRVLAGLGPVGMYVFDEVDAGVGGAVAEVIGRKIHEVAGHQQVLCITHLPQIAAFANQHFKVQKTQTGTRATRKGDKVRTTSQILRLSAEEQQEELARMLGGVRISDHARAAAAEMLQEAETLRQTGSDGAPVGRTRAAPDASDSPDKDRAPTRRRKRSPGSRARA